jgi:hypothetical protein
MITSNRPWSLKGNTLLDREGNPVGICLDWQNAELILRAINTDVPALLDRCEELTEKNKDLEEQINSLIEENDILIEENYNLKEGHTSNN